LSGVRAFAVIACALLGAAPALAQPADLPIAPATTDQYPPGVRVAKTAAGPVYADRRGRTLYGLDMRTVLRVGADPALYCAGRCEGWEPLLAPPGSIINLRFPQGFGPRAQLPPPFVANQSAPDWTVIAGPHGPQWVYKGWHLVYARAGDRAGSTALDGAEQMTWNTLKFVPPKPVIAAPPGVVPQFVDGRWVVASIEGRVLFTGRCKADCDEWRPLAGGMASGPVGDWSVDSLGERGQWTFRGKPVFVAGSDDPAALPASAKALLP
jgi:predicted lipoprotein with Yx(FWY)xxD motif